MGWMLPALLGAGAGFGLSQLGGGGGGPDVDVIDPLAKEKREAAQWLLNLMTGGTPEIPVRDVAGLTETEQFGQQLLDTFARAGEPEGYKTSMDYLKNLLGESKDVTQTAEGKAIISRVGRAGDERMNQLLRRIQIGGMSDSTPQGKAAGREVGRTMSEMALPLGNLAARKETLRSGAAGILPGLEKSDVLGKMTAISTFGKEPRMIEQMQRDALYDALMKQIMFPYEKLAPLAGGITGAKIDTAVTPPAPSIFQQIAPLLGTLGAAYLGRGGGGGGGSMPNLYYGPAGTSPSPIYN